MKILIKSRQVDKIINSMAANGKLEELNPLLSKLAQILKRDPKQAQQIFGKKFYQKLTKKNVLAQFIIDNNYSFEKMAQYKLGCMT